MILIVCLHCSNAIRVMSLQPGELESLFHSIPHWPVVVCPTCEKKAQGMDVNEVSELAMKMLTIRDLSPIEAHAAILGVGFPEEQLCAGVTISALFKEQKVRRVVGTDIPNTNRFCLDFMEFEDGSRAYFGASAHGAVIYRIARPSSYAKRADG